MPETTSRWLLLLGSNRGDDACLLAALVQLGSASLLTPIRRYPADDGSARPFYNALATWQPADASGNPREQIRRIELALGRDRTRTDEVAIDIDLLAQWQGGAWRAHPHALDKHEFERALVRGLLREAGVEMHSAAGHASSER